MEVYRVKSIEVAGKKLSKKDCFAVLFYCIQNVESSFFIQSSTETTEKSLSPVRIMTLSMPAFIT